MIAWNAFDEASESYRIRFSVSGAAPQDAHVGRSQAAFQLDLGRGPGDEARLVYSRFASRGERDVFVLDDLAAGKPARVRGAATRRVREEWPSVEGNTIAFVRDDKRVFKTRIGDRGFAQAAPVLPGDEASQVELDQGRIAVVSVKHAGDRRETQVLWLGRRDVRWREVARAASGALSRAEFRTPAFAPGNRLLFAHERILGDQAPQVASVALSGAPRLRELPLTRGVHPVALDTDAKDVALVTYTTTPDAGEDSCGASSNASRCAVQHLPAPALAPAGPRGYWLARR